MTQPEILTLFRDEDSQTESVLQFPHGDGFLSGESWSLSGTLRMNTGEAESRGIFRCLCDEENFSEFQVVRQTGDFNGIRRNITRNGFRLQTNSNELVCRLPDSEDWSVDFSLFFTQGFVYLFFREPGKQPALITSYEVDWPQCTPLFVLTGIAQVTLSNLLTETDPEKVREQYLQLAVQGDLRGSARLLFLGNSGMFYYDVPNTFSRLARQAGYLAEVNSVSKSNAHLYHHADPETDLGMLTAQELTRGYDVVFLQDATTCTRDETARQDTAAAVRTLAKTIRACGAKPWMYVRPPKNNYGEKSTPAIAAREYDELFTPLAAELDTTCSYINRAFALAWQTTGINLWHTDNAHPNAKGAYLAACVVFSTLFGTSCSVLGDDSLPAEEAKILREIADRIALEGFIPW